MIVKLLLNELEQGQQYATTTSESEIGYTSNSAPDNSSAEHDSDFLRSQSETDDRREDDMNLLRREQEQLISRESELKHEASMDAERKRIFDRHRFDIIAKSFGPESESTSLREFKRIFKIEMEENPERYTFLSRSGAKNADSGSKKKSREYPASEPSEKKAQREKNISLIRERLDTLIPQVKSIM